eukprot:1979325-Rhodomonas_salina.1
MLPLANVRKEREMGGERERPFHGRSEGRKQNRQTQPQQPQNTAHVLYHAQSKERHDLGFSTRGGAPHAELLPRSHP